MTIPDMQGATGFPGERVLVVDAASQGQRLDVFLAANLAGQSRSYLRKLIDDHRVMVEGRSVRASHRVQPGQRVSLSIPPPAPAEPAAEDIPLVVLFEDQDLVVIDKAAGLVVHPAPGNPDGTLVNALLHHCTDLSGVGGVLRPGIVHRLDRGTSGVMVVTKNDRAHRRLAGQFREHSTEKTYIAFARGRPGAKPLLDQGCFDTWFGRHPVHRKRFSSRVQTGKHARTEYRVAARYPLDKAEFVRVELRLVTGRTHQIRVHLADAGHPLISDKLYGCHGDAGLPREVVPDRPALHALQLAFDHPTSGRRMRFRAPLPDDLVRLGRWLEQSVAEREPDPEPGP